MWSIAMGVFHRIAGHTKWHKATRGDQFIWRRWTPTGWEYREMTEAEQSDAIAMWAIR